MATYTHHITKGVLATSEKVFSEKAIKENERERTREREICVK